MPTKQSMQQARMVLLESRVLKIQNEKEREDEKNRKMADMAVNKQKTKLSFDYLISDKQFVQGISKFTGMIKDSMVNKR